VDNDSWHNLAIAHPGDELTDLILSISGTMNTQTGDAFDLAISWLRSTPRNPMLFVHAGIGSGKSTLLYRLFSYLLRQLATATENSDPDNITSEWIPIHVDLCGMYFDDSTQVADLLLSRLSWYGTLSSSLDGVGSTREWKRRLFDCGDYRFVILFDGLDELEDSQDHPWRQSVSIIRHFIETNGGRICSIIAGRSGTVSPALLKRWSQLELQPINRSQVESSLEVLDNPTAFNTLLKKSPELIAMITTPLALQAALSYARDVERQYRSQAQSPTGIQPGMAAGTVLERSQRSQSEGRVMYDSGELVNEVISAIFRHEGAKDPARSRDETRIRRINALAQLAWQLDGRAEVATIESVSRAIGADEIVRVRQMGILVLASNADYRFASPVLKAYFAARHAVHLVRTANASSASIDWDLALRHATPTARFWVQCESLFTPMLDATERESAKAFYRFVQSTTLAHASNA
jgi:hypothetical protein